MTKKPSQQFVDSTVLDFVCPICLGEVPHFNHYVETECGHFFCKEHKPTLNSNCPICRETVSKFIESKKTMRDIKNLNLKCDHYEYGCKWKGCRSDLEQHLNKCLYVPIQCKWKKCETLLPRSSIKKHESECEWRIVACEYCKVEKSFNDIFVSKNN